MSDCNPELFTFPSLDRRKIEASFTGGDVSSDGGVLLLRQADRRTGLCQALNRAIQDPRHPDLVTHRQIDLLRQRIYGIALGYEDLNDHDTLRKDLAWQSAVERTDELASSPTLCRRESRANREGVVKMSKVLVEQFIASFTQPPTELTHASTVAYSRALTGRKSAFEISIAKGAFVRMRDISDSVWERIIAGAYLSDELSPKQKRLLPPK